MSTSVAQIEKELATLRDQEAADGHTGFRTNILDLVVYCDTATLAAEAVRAVQTMAHNRPSRALIAQGQADATEVAAETTVSCTLPPDGEGSLVCSDLVRLTGPTDGGALRAMITSLLLPDLPVFLVWLAPPEFDRPLFEGFADVATRLVTDSTRFPGTLEALPALADRRSPILTDLSWTAITGWREVVAQLFDVPDHAALLGSLEAVSIRHAEGSEAQARLLAGWIESRSRREGELSLEAVPGRDAAPGSILAVEILCAGERFQVERRDPGTAVTSSPGLPDQRRALPEPGLAELISEELEYFDEDRVFTDALQAATDLWR